jgi:hypothetical protein
MCSMKGVLVAVFALLSAAGAMHGSGNRPPSSVEGSLGARRPPVPTPTSCPVVTVICPDESELGKPVPFTVAITGGDPSVTPTFTWAVSAGTISSGQGTGSITVDRTGAAVGTTVTATVDVGGYDRACQTSASCTLNICNLKPQPRKLDEYGVIRTGDEKQRLDAFTVELQNDPTARGYLICYGGRRRRAGEARRRCERARTYLGFNRGIEASRVVTVDGGSRDVLTLELWLVPSGATPPRPTPTVLPGSRGRR